MRRVYKKNYMDWPAPLRKKLRAATLGKNGFMLESLKFNPVTYVMLDGDTLLGWALVAMHGENPMYDWHNFAMFYVKSAYRRQGVGTRIAKRIKRDYNPVRFGAYDAPAARFFESVGWKKKHEEDCSYAY